jgi:hypothetical protein
MLLRNLLNILFYLCFLFSYDCTLIEYCKKPNKLPKDRVKEITKIPLYPTPKGAGFHQRNFWD